MILGGQDEEKSFQVFSNFNFNFNANYDRFIYVRSWDSGCIV